MLSPVAWTPGVKSSASGVNVSSKNACLAWRNVPDRAAPGLFPPELVVRVKAMACELPATRADLAKLLHRLDLPSGVVSALAA
jgi:hypothetical protein